MEDLKVAFNNVVEKAQLLIKFNTPLRFKTDDKEPEE